MKITELKSFITDGKLNGKLIELYGEEALDAQQERYVSILDKALGIYGDQEAMIFSAPGRTEVGGNHTDHQLGRVLAAAINLDCVSVVIPREDKTVNYEAPGFKVKAVDLNNLEIVPEEKNTTESLIRGVAAGFVRDGYACGGFDAYAESNVLSGGGMSSSASFEVLIGTIFSVVYNEGKASAEYIAKIGQYAENVYFMKACGLMDQMACSVGSFVSIDFGDKDNPVVEKVDVNPSDYGYDLILTDVKASHADLSDEYSAIPLEMKAAAKVMGKEVLSEVTVKDVITNAKAIRETCGDRAYLRAYHFVNETERAFRERDALKNQDFDAFLKIVKESGYSSWMYLQNISVSGDPAHQAVGTALVLSDYVLGETGAYRVHGGGFAGTIQAFVKKELSAEYISTMESVFGEGCCFTLRIRNDGGVRVI